MPDDKEPKKDFTSDFNEAQYQINRLNSLWQACNLLSNAGRLEEWKWRLDTVRRELSPDIKQKDEGKGKENTIAFKIEELNQNIANAKERDDLYNALQEKEIFLRCLQDEVGKGSKKRATDEDEID